MALSLTPTPTFTPYLVVQRRLVGRNFARI
jgi:hypothetical protein